MKIIGYCAYCHDPIYEEDKIEIEGTEVFHDSCLKQKNTYCDSFGEETENVFEEIEE